MPNLGTGYVILKAKQGELKRDLDTAKNTVSSSVDKMKEKIGGITFKHVGIAAAAMATATAVALKSVKDAAVDAATTQEEAETKLAAVIKATGGAAGLTADEMKKMASAFQATTTFGDELVINAQAILATFKNIRGDAFERTTKAALDMSAVLDTDLKSAMIMLGKAVNDPLIGMSALTEAGIQFTQAQKDTARQLINTGRLVEAQAIVLEELESQFGGTASAMRDTFGGSAKAAENAFNGLLEEIGFGITTNEDLIDTNLELEKLYKELTPILGEFTDQMVRRFSPAILEAVGGLTEWIKQNEAFIKQDLFGTIRGGVDTMIFFAKTAKETWDVLTAFPSGVLDFFSAFSTENAKATEQMEAFYKAAGKPIPEPDPTPLQKFTGFMSKWGKDIVATSKAALKATAATGASLANTVLIEMGDMLRNPFVSLDTYKKQMDKSIKEHDKSSRAYSKTLKKVWSDMLIEMDVKHEDSVRERIDKDRQYLEETKQLNLEKLQDTSDLFLQEEQLALQKIDDISFKQIDAELKTLDKSIQIAEKRQQLNSDLYHELSILTDDYVTSSIKQLERRRDKAIEAGGDEVLAQKVYQAEIAKLVEEMNEKRLQETVMLYDEMKFSAEGYYDFELDRIEEKRKKAIEAGVSEQLANQRATEEIKRLDIEKAKSSQNFFDGFKAGLDDTLAASKTWGEQGYDAFQSFAGSSKSALSDLLFDAIKGDLKDLSSYWDSLWDSMLKKMIDIVIEMAAQKAIEGAAGFLGETMGWFEGGAYNIEQDSMAMVHAGEMIIPAKDANRIRDEIERDSIAYSETIADTNIPDDIDRSIVQSFAKGTISSAMKKTAVGGALAATGGISSQQLISGLLSPGMLISSTLMGGVPEAVSAGAGLSGIFSNIGKILPTVAAVALGAPGILGTVAAPLGMLAGDAVGDLLNLRENEVLRDRLESQMGYFAGRRTYRDISQNDWYTEVLNDMAGKGEGLTQDELDIVAEGAAYTGMSPEDIDYGVDAGADMEDFGGNDEGDWGGATGYFAKGGIAEGPTSGFPAVLHGTEAVVPLPDGRSIPVNMKGSNGGMVLNAPMIHIEGNLIADQNTFDDFVEKIETRLYEFAQLGH